MRDLLICLAIAGLFQARWSEQILDECFDNVVDNRPDLTPAQLARTRRLMKTALPDASVTGYEDRIADFDLPDPDDRHVLAAAVTAGASFLVTDNLDDFPAEPVPEGLRVVSPDEFVLELANDDLDVVVDVLESQVAGLSRPRRVISGRLTGMADGERQLRGGIANAGQVVRVGSHVLRPSGPHSVSVHAFLRAVRDAGFEGAPVPVGIDADGRERLEFIDGNVPTPPYPAWCQTEKALASVARLLRGLHDAARGFDPRRLTWNDALADPAGGTIVCHNDLELSNVVFRSGVAVALLDFEFAAPGRPVYDLAQLCRLCVPIDDDVDQHRLGWRPADRPARLRLAADAYRLDRNGRAELLSAVDDAIDRIGTAARRSVAAGDPNATDLWNRTGGEGKYTRRRRWWDAHHDRFAAALR